jgi:predicted nucleotidyltransferase
MSAPPVDSLLETLVASIHATLGNDLVGIYLYGSCVSGGFDPGVSDVDLVTVTAREADQIDLAGLGQVHDDVVSLYPDWIDRLEVVYVGRAALRSFRTSTARLAVISPGEPFHLRDDRVVEWLQNWYLIREAGRTLFGPPAGTLVPPISMAEFVAAAAHYADQISRQSLVGATPGARAYAVLTICRALRTVETGTHSSKQEGADWTRSRMPEWAWLIDAALRCRLSRGSVGFDDERARAGTDELIALVAARIAKAPAPELASAEATTPRAEPPGAA